MEPGLGYGTEVLTWACDYMFNVLGLHRCGLIADAENARAIKCYEKIGFVHEGIQRSAFFSHGHWKDEVSMGLLEDEWRAKQAS